MKKSLTAVAALGATAALLLLGVPAASAVAPTDLPAAQDLYAIDCDAHAPQLWRVAANGASTPVGNAHLTASGTDCAGGGQTNPVDGVSYYFFYDSPQTFLASVDLTTGVSTIGPEINGDTDNGWQLIITNSGESFIVDGNVLYEFSLATATTSVIGPINPAQAGAVGYDPTTDTIYAIDATDTINVYTVDRTTAAVTNIGLTGTWPLSNCLAGGTDNTRPDTVSFDSAGFAWVQSDSCLSSVMSIDLTTGDAVVHGQIFDATGTLYPTAPNGFYTETFLMGPDPLFVAAPDPALAATGVDGDATLITGSAAALAAVLGVFLLARNRRRTA